MEGASTPSLGLSLAYFHCFVDDHGGRDCFQGLTTLDVCERFVKPYTSTSQLSLVDHVHSQPRGHEYAKPAQWLISHSWSYQFLDVVDAIDGFCHEQELSPDTSFWFCMFANNQHAIGEPSVMFTHWLQAFRTALEFTGKMVMVLSPWHDPETLKRTWCVYEVYLSIVLNARFEVAMGTTQKLEFLVDIKEEKSILRMLGQINSSNSITTEPSDRDHIFKLIEDQVGFVKLDRMVFVVIQSWVLRTLDGQVHLAVTPPDRCTWLFAKVGPIIEDNQYERAQLVYQEALDIFKQTPDLLASPAFSKGWEAQLYVGVCMARRLLPRETWEPLCDEAFPKLLQLVSRDDTSTFFATINLGLIYCADRDYTRGMPLMWDSLELAKAYHGDQYVLDTQHYIGRFYSNQNQLDQAEAMLQPAYVGLCHLLGPTHKEALKARATLTFCYSRQGRYREAEQLMQLNLQESLRTLASTNHAVWSRSMNLAATQRLLGKYDEVRATLTKCLAAFETLGDDVWVLHCRRNMGLLHFSTRDCETAKTCLESVHKGYLKTFAPSHPFCQGVLFELYVVKFELDTEFNSVAAVQTFQQLLADANIANEAWSYHSCHKCFVPIKGDLALCLQCPRYSVRYCKDCLSCSDRQLVCGHNDGPWTAIPPPARFLDNRMITIECCSH